MAVANKRKTAKPNRPRGKGKPWAKGQSGNPKGRPRTGQSFAEVMKNILGMTGPQVAETYQHHAREFGKLSDSLTIRELVALRWAESIINEPSPGLLQQMIDRTDGPVPTVHAGDADSPITVKVIYVRRTNSGATGIAPEPSQSES